MPVLISYLLKFSISISSVFLFYQLLLRKLTFYNWNRWFLLGYSLLSFIIPFINISPIVEEKKMATLPAIQYIPTLENYTVHDALDIPQNNYHAFNYWNLLIIILAAGSLALLIRFIIQCISLQKIKKASAVMTDEQTTIYEVPQNIIPFSFGNSIFINPKLHTEKEFEEIILHEYVHVKQKHTADILFAEFLCMINWYNPFAWFIRYAIKQNLEFIADHFVLQKGFDKKAYQYHLLKVIGSPQYRITNNFNFSSLKKRIVMMNALKSAKVQLGKFLFLLPLIALLLVAFRDKYEKEPKKQSNITPTTENTASHHRVPGVNIEKDTIPANVKNSSVKKPDDKNSLSDSVLYVIDGVELPKKLNFAPIINPNVIESMNVLKGKDAIKKYGKKGEHGVIEISTKPEIGKFSLSSDSTGVEGLMKNEKIAHIQLISGQPKPLILVDGKEIPKIEDVNPDQIESITVLKDSTATKGYGEKAKDGVIIIKTKKNTSSNPLPIINAMPQTDITIKINILNYLEEYLKNDINRFHLVPENLGLDNTELKKSISIYNTLQIRRNEFRESENNLIDKSPFDNDIEKAKQHILALIRFEEEKYNQQSETGINKYPFQLKGASDNLLFMVDGVKIDSEDVKKLKKENIASVNISYMELNKKYSLLNRDGYTVINILTKNHG